MERKLSYLGERETKSYLLIEVFESLGKPGEVIYRDIGTMERWKEKLKGKPTATHYLVTEIRDGSFGGNRILIRQARLGKRTKYEMPPRYNERDSLWLELPLDFITRRFLVEVFQPKQRQNRRK